MDSVNIYIAVSVNVRFKNIYTFYYSPANLFVFDRPTLLLMHMEVGPVRVLHPVFEEVVNNCFGLNLYSFCSVK